jgi:hypothetical protein
MNHLCRGDSIPVSGRQCGRSEEGRRLWCVVRDLHQWRLMSRSVWPMLLLAVLLASAVFPLSGCGTGEDVRDKLDSRLLGLIDAEKRGEIESFARMAVFDLVDGSVRVLIDYVPGQLEAAVKAAERFGTVETIDYSAKKVQALIPVTSLTALAKEESIRFIRDPVESATE